jgi:dimethylargininase
MSVLETTIEFESEKLRPSWLKALETEGAKPRFKALTRGVSQNIGSCELTYKERETIDAGKAERQLQAYNNLLMSWGIDFLTLPGNQDYPDCCFVQDTAVVLDEVCIVANMGAASRRGETSVVEKVLRLYRKIEHIASPATLDGGDVVQFGRRLFVGLSRRTNRQGMECLRRIVDQFGYTVEPVEVNGGLHLTTGCGIIDDETVLLNPRWLNASAFTSLRQLHVPETEPWAANTIRVNEAVCLEANAPRTFDLVVPYVKNLDTIDISEFRKAEGSLSCLSLIFKDNVRT